MIKCDLRSNIFNNTGAIWFDWRWQQANAIRDIEGIKKVFPHLQQDVLTTIEKNIGLIRFQLTPYLLSLVRLDKNNSPISDDPIWNIYVPASSRIAEYDPISTFLNENWELPEDMINPILQHKYENRVNFRIQNHCLSYCLYCFEAKRVLDRKSEVGSFSEEYFTQAIDYIQQHHEVEEVIISGGEPLTLSNEKLETILQKIRQIVHVSAVRIQTRAFAQNPFRIDDYFINLLKKYDVSAMGIHITHPIELTNEFRAAVDKFGHLGCRTLLLAQIPLLKGINDNETTLTELIMSLYNLKIKPYYLLHALPETLFMDTFRTSVRDGVELMRRIKRRISNPAVPEYIIVHAKGKQTVPFEIDGTTDFQYLQSGLIKFKNWKGELCEYKDIPNTN